MPCTVDYFPMRCFALLVIVRVPTKYSDCFLKFNSVYKADFIKYSDIRTIGKSETFADIQTNKHISFLNLQSTVRRLQRKCEYLRLKCLLLVTPVETLVVI